MSAKSAQGGAFHDVYWPDAELVGVEIGFETLTVCLREVSGTTIRVICEGHLGYEHVGVWDESVIERAELTANGPFLDQCVSDISRRLGPETPPSGSIVRNTKAPMQLVATFIDGSQLNIALNGLRVERI